MHWSMKYMLVMILIFISIRKQGAREEDETNGVRNDVNKTSIWLNNASVCENDLSNKLLGHTLE